MSPLKGDKLVSVIIPVYNVEKYIDECITSVTEQSYKNIEIILIDDGSTDSSGDLCDKWAQKDARISVIHQNNGGLSAARNSGLDAAKGDYLCFVDSDDYIKESYIESFVMAIEAEDADIAFCDIESTKLCEAELHVSDTTVMTPKECRELLCNPLSREYVEMVVAWNKLYKCSLFDNLRFEAGKLHEDEYMINNFIYKIGKAVYIPSRNYVYRDNTEGITGADNVNDIRHLQVIDAYAERIDRALENSDEGFATTTLKWALLKLIDYFKKGNGEMRKMAMEKYESIFNSYKQLLSRSQKLKYTMFRACPFLYNVLFG